MATKKSAKKTPTSGVDVKSLSLNKFNLLVEELTREHNERVAQQEAAKLAKLKESGKYDALLKERKELFQEFKSLLGNHTIDVNIPLKINFKIGSSARNFDEIDFCSYDNSDLIEIACDVDVDGAFSETDGLSKTQLKMLDDRLKTYLRNACEEVIGLLPDEVKDKAAVLNKKIKAFYKKTAGIELEDEVIPTPKKKRKAKK